MILLYSSDCGKIGYYNDDNNMWKKPFRRMNIDNFWFFKTWDVC